SQSIVNTFNNYIAAGNDIGKLSKDEIDAVISGAAALPPIEHPETDAARMLMLHNKKEHESPTTVQGLAGQAAQSFLGLAVNLGGQTLDALSHATGHSILDKGFGEWLDYYTKQSTANAMGLRYNLGGDGLMSLINGGVDIWKSIALKNEQNATVDPDKGAQLDVKQSEIIRQRLLRETQAQKNMTDVRDAVAGTYKQIGADNLAKTAMSVQPDDPLVQTAQIVTDPSTYLMGAGEAVLGKVFGGAVKAGTRLQRFTEAGVRVGEIEDHLATTALARTNLEAALHGPVPLDAEVKAGLESQVSRIKTVQANLSDTYSAAKAE